MFFANAMYTSAEYGVTSIAICSDKQTELLWANKNTDAFTRVFYERPIAKAVMRAAAQDVLPINFECNGIRYTLLKYNFRVEERFYNKNRKNYVVRKERIARYCDIYVCSERCRCTKCFNTWGYGTLENICGKVETLYSPRRIIEIDLQYCRKCGEYFIDSESLAEYEREYGPLRITKHHITGNEEEGTFRESFTYKKDTVLSRNGYSARLSTSERQRILVNLILSGESSKAEIKDILTRFISQRGNRCPYAKPAWENDLKFVNEYNLENQDLVRFK